MDALKGYLRIPEADSYYRKGFRGSDVLQVLPAGQIKHALFDSDGTASILREGWERVMAPVCVEAICGAPEGTPEICAEVAAMIDRTTGINTILQMAELVGMVSNHGLVSQDKILDAQGYKDLYLQRLMVPVRERIAQIESGKFSAQRFMVSGIDEFLAYLQNKVSMRIFSGTDQEDVRNELNKLGLAQYFKEIFGALKEYADQNKKQILLKLMSDNNLSGPEVVVFGDGPVELQVGKEAGCVTVAVASDEVKGYGWNEAKLPRLLKCEPDLIIPDFSVWPTLAYILNFAA